MSAPLRDAIGPDHPALAGHFPGNPIVPGVVLLARVCRACVAHRGETGDGAVTAVRAVKFHALLRPGEPFEMAFEPAGGNRVDFRVMREGTLIAAGALEIGPREWKMSGA